MVTTKIFVNLPVKDLKRSSAFYSALGYRFNQQFSDEKAASFAISDDIYVMLLVEPFFKTFTPRPVADGRSATEVITALTADSKDEVNRIAEAALAAGAVEAGPTQELAKPREPSFIW